MVSFIKGNGRTIRKMDTVSIILKTKTSTKEILFRINEKDKAYIIGFRVILFKGIGVWIE